ncbi:uncharacterized protein LOC111412500 [Olea europaea var. sylvestris]|uniref:uncharacterized protein LOC111412500 n=1 Tax=Olea europaea var. sylvestris TaxID=158386 RepID=UPI000C1D115F|nr:uncharacterized protein LOC111412500 [Olea europaea var. sylvestris]
MEAAQRSTPMAVASQKVKEPNSVKNIKKLLSGRGQDRSEDAHSIKGSGESKRVGSQKLKSKEKSVVQANGNIQKKEELIQVGNGSSEKQKEHNEIKSNFVGRNQSNAPKRMEKRSSLSRPSDVLRQNHQKQNCVSNRVEGNYKPSVSQQKDRKDLPTNYINGRGSKTVSKIVVNNVVPSRKTNSVTTDAGKEFSSSRVNTPVKKKQPINRNIQSDRALAESILMAKDERLVKCNVSVEGNTKWDAFDRNNGLDVVSFTFTSPIKKSGAASSSSSKMLEVTKSSSPISNPSDHQSDFKNSDASSLASNIIGRDALSVILEHKLKELTSRVEMSQQELLEASSFSSIANSYQNTGPTIKLVNPTEKDDLNEGKWESQNNFDSPFVDKLWLKEVKEHQGLLDKQEYSNNNNTEHESYLNISILRSTKYKFPLMWLVLVPLLAYMNQRGLEGKQHTRRAKNINFMKRIDHSVFLERELGSGDSYINDLHLHSIFTYLQRFSKKLSFELFDARRFDYVHSLGFLWVLFLNLNVV